MKYIQKGQEPREFTDWKALANNDWQPAWHNFSGAPKQATHQHLIEEQGYVCCYCGQSILAGNRPNGSPSEESSHIEHLRPRSERPELELDYTNLLASCLSQLEKKQPRHCGVAKGDWFDENMVHPLDPNCAARLQYTADGRIYPSNDTDQGAEETIHHLKLGITKLEYLRKGVIEGFLDPVLMNELSVEQLKELIEKLENTDTDGRRPAFYFVVTSVLKGFLP